jgi:polysaccharide export outer membrane protein
MIRKPTPVALFAILGMLLGVVAGCGTPSGGGAARPPATNEIFSVDLVHVGDQIRIVYEGPGQIQPTDAQVPESGMITIHQGEQIRVAGKKADDIAQEIRTLFTVTKQIYKRFAVVVQVQNRSISVGGDVRTPNSFTFEGGMTVLKAINRAGGFTEFADRKNVLVTRFNGQQLTVNCKAALKKPELDIPLFPGDRITVPRGIL